MKNVELLYYECCDRIDENIEIAEPFLAGCIYYIAKGNGREIKRQSIKDNLCMSNYKPYARELQFISTIGDDSLHALITSSLDLSAILKQVEIIYEHAKDSDYSLVQESTHTNKAERAAKMLNDLANQMKKTTKIKKDVGLFEDGE